MGDMTRHVILNLGLLSVGFGAGVIYGMFYTALKMMRLKS